MALADKVKKIIKSRAFLLKLVTTILVFICVPLLAVQIFVISETTNEFRKTNQDHYLTLLQGSAQTFSSREGLLRDTAWRMSRNEAVQKPLRHTTAEYPLLDKEAADAISSYSAEILHVKAAGVFYISKGYLLTNGCKYTLQAYCDMMEPAVQEEGQEKPPRTEQSLQMEEFFRSRKNFAYHTSSDGSTLIAALPISLGVVGRNDAIAFFTMDAASLEESYRANISCQSSIAVLDDEGRYLLKGEDFNTNIQSNVLSQFLESKEIIGSADGAKNLLLYRYTDPKSDFTFLLAADRDDAQEQLLKFAQTVRVSMYVMVAVIVISLLVTIHITYRPIHRLLQKYGSSEGQDAGSEIERLDSAFVKLDKEASNQQELLTDFILGDLLFGNAVKPELITRYFPEERYRSFVVMTAICPTMMSGVAKQIEETLEDLTGYDIYVTSVPSRPHTVIACLSRDEMDTNMLQYHCICTINEIIGTQCPVCVGEVVCNIRDLRRSYRSAVTVNLDPLKAEPGSNAGELAKLLQPLSQCVYMGDEAEALKHLENIRQFLYGRTVGEGHLRYYGFKLLQAYLTSIDNSQTQLTGQEVELLLSFSSMDHLFKLLTESIHQICSQVVDMEQTVDAQLQQRLIEYVDAHFMENGMCLSMAADHVGTSIYAVSRTFKEITGHGFKDYISEKRLEYSHELLSTTAMSVADIATAAGFENANYFSTLFKAKYGLPPTKYRNEQKKKQEN